MAINVATLDLPQLPLFGEEERDHRIETLRNVAKDNWIAKNAFGYSILKYDDVVAVLRDKRWFSAVGFISESQPTDNEEYNNRPRQNSILSADGPEHVRLRRLVAPAFNPRVADRLRPIMRDVLNSLVDPIAKTGSADFVSAVCEPYPIPIICELLGAPKKDWKLFSRVAADILKVFDGNLNRDAPLIMKAQDDLSEYVQNWIAARRNVPADDLITDLITAEEQGDKLNTQELVTMVGAVIIGGTDTTRNQLGLALILFAEHPDQWKLLGEHPEMAPRAVEECMRYFGAVRGTGRYAIEDIEYKGVLFPKGTLVMPSLGTSNFDDSVFPEPENFDITREPVGQPQLTFGSGVHYCLGASLARAELQEALIILSRRLPNLALAGDIVYKAGTAAIFGPEKLPITFTPGH